MRGEQYLFFLKAQSLAGSPPLARGTAGHAAAVQRLVGITPACAGNSPFACALFGAFKDHPRLRGEQRPTRRIDGFMAGSPPLARGTAFTTDEIIMLSGITPACAGNSKCIAYKKVSLGITPACAGNSLFVLIGAYLARDHPRLRGEQYISPSQSTISLGSPPLARGTELVSTLAPLSYRITPACAGNRWIGYDSWSAT